MLLQLGNIDNADVEPAIKPSVFRNSLLVCLFILVPFIRLCMDYLLIEKSSFAFPAFRAYPNNPLYCGRLQSPMPALSAKNVLNVEKTTSPSILRVYNSPVSFLC